MMLENYSTAGISIIQSVPRGGCPRQIYTSFVLRKKLENNAANESKIGQ